MTKPSDRILIGWDSIRSAWGMVCIKTMKRDAKKYGLLIKSVNGKPAIRESDLMAAFDRLPQKEIEGRRFPQYYPKTSRRLPTK